MREGMILARTVATFAFCVFAGTAVAAPACSNDEALGTARDLAVAGPLHVGLKTYPQTLDLAEHEVVLTFDDGPSPATTPKVLEALRAQCVWATFFLIGRNAAAFPRLVREEVADGHSVGHHSWSHPAVTLRGLAVAAARAEIEHGMAADDVAAYGSWTGRPRVPFFRFPGFADATPLLEELDTQHVAVFGADLWASDWIPMTPDAELDRLMARLEVAGRGIVLLHDIKPQTAAMLPRFLSALKAAGFRVVHLEPAPAGSPTPTRPAPASWTSETAATLDHMWPRPRAALRASQGLGPTQP